LVIFGSGLTGRREHRCASAQGRKTDEQATHKTLRNFVADRRSVSATFCDIALHKKAMWFPFSGTHYLPAFTGGLVIHLWRFVRMSQHALQINLFRKARAVSTRLDFPARVSLL
jgi:hypothetical protein